MKMKWLLTIALALISAATVAETVLPNQYAIWGLGQDEISIPAGSVITEAVLTIQNVSPVNATVYVHLLDNPTEGLNLYTDNSNGNVFTGYGVPLNGTYENGNYVCRFSQINDSQSRIWQVFSNPCAMTLADGSSVQFSSSLLELMDYLGNGKGMGIGVDNGAGTEAVFDSLQLELTVETYQGTASSQTMTFAYPSTSTESAYALQFDGVDDRVELNCAALTNTFTISAWVKATAPHEIDKEGTTGYPGISGQRYLFGCTRGLGVDDAGMGVSVGTNGISVYELRPSYMPALAVYAGDLGTGWNHIAITYTNKRPSIYLNGVLVRTGLVSPRSTVFSSIQVGGSKDCLSYGLFPGLVSDVSVWNYACTQQQIQQEVISGLDGTESDLSGYWKLDDGNGTAVSDSSSNNNTGTVYGATWTEGIRWAF